MRVLTLVLLALAGSCQSGPDFAYAVPTGRVQANDMDDARLVATMADECAHRVVSILDVPLEPQFVLYFDDRSEALNGVRVWRDKEDRITERRIELGAKSRQALRFLVAHELVHWYANGLWDRLPLTIEEGLADVIGLQLDPGFAKDRRAVVDERLSRMTRAEFERALIVTRHEVAKLPREQRLVMYTVGLTLVDQLGIDRLRALCERAESAGEPKIPMSWILAEVTLPSHLAEPTPVSVDPDATGPR